MNKPKRGDRYLNYIGEYCLILSVYNNIVKIRVTGDKFRYETWKLKDMSDDKWHKLPYPKITRSNVARHILEYQLNLVGKKTSDTKLNDNWADDWTITQREYDYLHSYSIPLLKKVLKVNKTKALEIFDWWFMMFGLKQKDNV